jgi:hypothetical protein
MRSTVAIFTVARASDEFRTQSSLGTDDSTAGDYTVHNPFLVGDTLCVSWYSDSVQVSLCGPDGPDRS